MAQRTKNPISTSTLRIWVFQSFIFMTYGSGQDSHWRLSIQWRGGGPGTSCHDTGTFLTTFSSNFQFLCNSCQLQLGLCKFHFKKRFSKQTKNFFGQDEQAWRKRHASQTHPRLVILDSNRQQEQSSAANDNLGPRGLWKCQDELSKQFWWPSLLQGVEQYVKTLHEWPDPCDEQTSHSYPIFSTNDSLHKVYLNLCSCPHAQG